MLRRFFATGVFSCLLFAGCQGSVFNSPYPSAERATPTYYSWFGERPKHLDPARSYSSNEAIFTGQIYEPPLQYHFLHRPFRLIPLTATEVPQPRYFGADGAELPEGTPDSEIARSSYTIRIQPGILYQPHPAFVRDGSGRLTFHNLTEDEISKIGSLSSPRDFPQMSSRELVADDYVYQLKRLADPRVQSPIRGFMSAYIIGFDEFARLILEQEKGARVDLRTLDLTGVQLRDRYTYEVSIKGKYPQFLYWLAMPFFAPLPYEVDAFYQQEVLAKRNITIDWFPVGTGPYMLVVNDPNRRLELLQNPNFRRELYPEDGSEEDRRQGLLESAGQPLPLIKRAVYSLEKEAIPSWSKFLQGYYDSSGISADSFEQAIQFTDGGEATLTEEMSAKGLRLVTSVSSSIFYTGFNMLDPVVGGYSEQARALRQAISLALEIEEFISIFVNGRGIPAQGPIPPGIFGYEEGSQGINSIVYEWRDGRPQRKSIEQAKHLLSKAGYPNGRNSATGEPLVLYLDIAAGGPDSKAELDWLVKKFAVLGVQLVVRSTDYNTFQDKMLKGKAQIYQWGWNADYPDPENFLFLLYGKNSKVNSGGENASNYDNPEFNAKFEAMKNMSDGPERAALVKEMLQIVRADAPWVWGFHPKSYALVHSWLTNVKPHQMANNTLKYLQLNPELRERNRQQWNQPVFWPLWLLIAAVMGCLTWGVICYRRRERMVAL